MYLLVDSMAVFSRTPLLRVGREALWSIVTQESPAQMLGLPPQVNVLRLQQDSIHALPPSALDYSSVERDVGALTNGQLLKVKNHTSWLLITQSGLKRKKNLKISSLSVC